MTGLGSYLKGSESILQELCMEMSLALSANSLSLVLKESDSKFYVEKSSWGFANSKFFYSFLTQEKESFSIIASSENPVAFSADIYSAFHINTRSILVMKVFYLEMLGFIVLEFSENHISYLKQLLVKLFAQRLAKTIICLETESNPEMDLDLRKGVHELEREKIETANRIFEGNQVRMAKALGISRGSLQYRLKQMELNNGL
jgi:DNA-binding protein Fis